MNIKQLKNLDSSDNRAILVLPAIQSTIYFFEKMARYFKRLIGFILIYILPDKVAGQLHITAVGRNYVEIQLYNQTSAVKQTINPYFLGFSKSKGNTYTFDLFRDRYRFFNDTLFLYLNDTAIIPGIEKFNQVDSFRLMKVEKYATLLPQDEFKVMYRFPTENFSFIMLYYTISNLPKNYNDTLALLYARKRKLK